MNSAVAGQLAHAHLDGQSYHYAETTAASGGDQACAFLLPPFDELLVAYNNLIVPGGNGIFNPIVVIDGRGVGTWKCVLKADRVLLSFSPFHPWSDSQAQALPAAIIGQIDARGCRMDARP